MRLSGTTVNEQEQQEIRAGYQRGYTRMSFVLKSTSKMSSISSPADLEDLRVDEGEGIDETLRACALTSQ